MKHLLFISSDLHSHIPLFLRLLKVPYYIYAITDISF